MLLCAKGFQKQQISFKNNITVECTWWKGKWELERVGVDVGGGRIGGVRPVLLSSSLFLSLRCGRRGGVTDICFGNIFTHWLALLDEGLVGVLCVWGPAGAAVVGGSVKTQKICSNSRFHNGVKWSEEMSAWPWHCTVILGSAQQSSLSHTHTEGWLVHTDIFTMTMVQNTGKWEAHKQKLNSASQDLSCDWSISYSFKWEIFSSFTHHYVIPNLHVFLFSVDHKKRCLIVCSDFFFIQGNWMMTRGFTDPKMWWSTIKVL